MRQLNRIFKLAIDGPSGVGKSSTANALAKKLSFVRIDSGTLYRALTYILLKDLSTLDDFILVNNKEKIKKIEFFVSLDNIYHENEDIKPKLKTPIIDKNVSIVARHSFVREKIKKMQYELINKLEVEGCKGIIIDGRDIGTVILPDADLKIYLTADVEVRARRRYAEMDGVEYERVYEDMLRRDYDDINREHGPLKKAEDAYEIDTSMMSLEDQIQTVLELVIKNEG